MESEKSFFAITVRVSDEVNRISSDIVLTSVIDLEYARKLSQISRNCFESERADM